MWDPRRLRPYVPRRRPSLSSGFYFVFSRLRLQVMNAPQLKPLDASPHTHWTDPVPSEETFRKVDWRPPNHKPKPKKVVTYAKSAWDR
jgi:hypothetical protein